MAEPQTLAAPQGFNGGVAENPAPAGQMPSAAQQSQGAQLPSAQQSPQAQPAGLPSLREVLAQPLVRRSIPPILALFTLLFFVMVYFWANEGNLRALYPNMSEADRSQAYEQLLNSDIGVSLDNRSGSLMVPTERYYEARMLLASAGLPAQANAQAMDSLGAASSMTTSQFMEQAQYTAAIESELSKSIVQISSVQSARVHLAAPRQSSYVRNREPAKASVVVIAHPGRTVSAAQVQAITSLVASSVPYLSIDDVSVVDQQGSLLTSGVSAGLAIADEQAAFKRSIETEYKNKIVDLLTPIYGRENIQSDVDVTLDFSEFEATNEIFDANGSGPKAVSEVLVLDTSSSQTAGGVPGAQSNIAPNDTVLTAADGGEEDTQAGTNGGVRSSQTTRNYEIDRSIQYEKKQTGVVTKMSVAVVINEAAFGPRAENEANDGAANAPRDTTQIQGLVANAVGFSQARGDSVAVLVSPFRDLAIIEDPMSWYENPTLFGFAKMLLVALTFALVVVFVIRPLITAFLSPAPALADGALLANDALSADEAGAIDFESGETLEQIKAKLKPKKSSISADMLDTANTYDDKVALVRMLVSEDSGRVANVLKKMVTN
ncbi:MAG: flagellar basal-body MS-ring/collar protein FliF [Gammaproteobacteria bacterium]|nr:flagellar basal-body MS-ring/collar protein FliF [Gammaproteobacteria bacterium]